MTTGWLAWPGSRGSGMPAQLLATGSCIHQLIGTNGTPPAIPWKGYGCARISVEQRPDKLFHIWGHSCEFHRDDNWQLMEDFCDVIGREPGVWHATCLDICRYVRAWRSLETTIRGDVWYNPSAETVWFRQGDELHRLEPGASFTA